MKALQFKLIIQKLLGRETAGNNLTLNATRILGTILITLSGLILYTDKVFGYFNIMFGVPDKFSDIGWDFNTFIWFMAQTISPMMLIVGSLLKNYKIAYVVPLYFYILQLYYVLFDFKIIDNGNYILYALGSTLLVLMIIITIKRLSLTYVKAKIQKEKERIKHELH